jgi:hypothetical protein
VKREGHTQPKCLSNDLVNTEPEQELIKNPTRVRSSFNEVLRRLNEALRNFGYTGSSDCQCLCETLKDSHHARLYSLLLVELAVGNLNTLGISLLISRAKLAKLGFFGPIEMGNPSSRKCRETLHTAGLKSHGLLIYPDVLGNMLHG